MLPTIMQCLITQPNNWGMPVKTHNERIKLKWYKKSIKDLFPHPIHKYQTQKLVNTFLQPSLKRRGWRNFLKANGEKMIHPQNNYPDASTNYAMLNNTALQLIMAVKTHKERIKKKWHKKPLRTYSLTQ